MFLSLSESKNNDQSFVSLKPSYSTANPQIKFRENE